LWKGFDGWFGASRTKDRGENEQEKPCKKKKLALGGVVYGGGGGVGLKRRGTSGFLFPPTGAKFLGAGSRGRGACGLHPPKHRGDVEGRGGGRCREVGVGC